MRANRAINLAAGAIILVAAAAMVSSVRDGSPPRIEREPPQAVGWAAAQQALRLRKEGGKIIVIARDTATFANPASDAQLEAFKKVLRKARVSITSVHTLQVDPLRPVEVPPGDFLEWIRSTSGGDVIVSFMGPPLLNEAQQAQVRESRPAVIAFCSGNLAERVDLRPLFEKRLLEAAIINRPDPASSTPPKDLQGWFDREFLLVTNAQGIAPQNQ